MKILRSSTGFFHKSLASEESKKISFFILVFGLMFFTFWLGNYSWTIITTPYPAEYREGAILLLTDFLIQGINPYTLEHHPLMTNLYGFLYSLIVMPFAMIFGNTLAVHRIISILFILASCMLVIFILIKNGTTFPFAMAGGGLLMASLLFTVTPLARPDSLGEFLFLITILFPWCRKFDIFSLIVSGLTGILAFLAKPYFLLSVGIVSAYIFIFVSKKKGLFYSLFITISFIPVLYTINIFLECYFLDIILSSMANSILSNAYMLEQLSLFVKAFLPCSLILLPVAIKHAAQLWSSRGRLFTNKHLLNINNFDQPLIPFPINYFAFFLVCTFTVVVFFLGRNIGAYMSYFFQLITPGLILVIFVQREILHKNTMVSILLILINFSVLCFYILYPNQLSNAHQKEWERLYRYLASSPDTLNSPVLVPEMIRLNMIPVDSGQSEYYFITKPYRPNPFAPDYEQVSRQGRKYLNSIRFKVQNQIYDYVIVTANQVFLPFPSHSFIDRFYNQVELITIAMPQTGEYWTIEVNSPQNK